EQGAIMLLDSTETDDQFRTIVREIDTDTDIVPYHFGVQLSGWMIKNQMPLLINDFPNDNRFVNLSGEEFPINSILSVPLKTKGKIIGVLNVFNKISEDGFTPNDQRMLSIIAAQSAQAIESARLYDEEKSLKIIEEELNFATEIQTNLLPKLNPQIDGFDIAGKSVPAKEVGGDYYDFIPIDKNKNAICLGDISGKGMPAAMLMANLQATLRGQALFTSSAEECLTRANKLLYRSTDLQKFATLFYGILDTAESTFHFSNAGHDFPFLIDSDKKVTRLTKGGTVLGFMEDYQFEEDSIKLNTSDTIIIYSDGIPDAMNEQNEYFGEDRLLAILTENIKSTAEMLIEKVFDAIKTFVKDAPQSDDITIVVIKKN
ncbi:MAG: PP2C family protein-serine/threonine phosphatase, partial [Candidatus Marinimicrobia bacterium]|nr:PP2C family protein-serine/threonine phosphatase [Candidatus Neomarinimicrobiota bacterium]